MKVIATAVIAIIAIILSCAATKPSTFHIEHSTDGRAPPEKIFPLINDLHKRDAWTSYNKDPAMKKTFSGASAGVGASYAWEGNGEVGKGEVSITESVPPSKVVFDLHMIKPLEGRNRVVFTLETNGDSTNVI